MPNYWLLKTEPSTYSFAQLVQDQKTVWDGVRNALALSHLRKMKKGDRALVYHTGAEKAVVGIARLSADAYPDPKVGDPQVVVVDLAPERALARPVPLAAIKADPLLQGMPLVRISRLSVMPVTPEEWKHLLDLGG
jgi:predicted RNA-binding protein with PUA-like domain